MEFSLMHAGLAAGAAMAAVPVILHLFMKPTPKHVVFPALRLIRERQKRSKKKMRIKNWLLLAARMLLLALMALALARPRLHSETPLGDDSVPTALGLVFDTSLSMGYMQNDKSLLDQAKERAREIIDRIPDSSLVFAVNSADPGAPVGLSPSTARKWIDDLAVRPVNRPLNMAMGQVYSAVAECDRPRREVYVLTDLTKSAWDSGRPAEGLDKVEKAGSAGGKIATVVLRLGPPERENVSLDEATLPANVAPQGEPVEVRGLLRAHGPKPAERIVEFYLDGVKRDQKPVELQPGGQAEVRFLTPAKLKEGEVHRAELRVTGAPDPLKFDDQRFLSFEVRPALKVLLVSDLNVDAEFVSVALDPDQAPGAARSYQTETTRAADLATRYRESLKGYAAVFLLNVEALDAAAWGLINAYVHEGGGLVVGLGDRCKAENYNGPVAGQVLPAQLAEAASPPGKGTTFGKIADVTHPMFDRYAREIDAQFAVMPVYRYWKIQAGGPGRTLLNFADGAPALQERNFKGARTGRVLMWATPLARRVRRSDPAAWNEFPNSSYWAFPVVMNLTIPYLAGSSGDRLDFEAGDDVMLNLGPDAHPQDVLVTGPDGKTTERTSPPPAGEPLKLTAPQLLGQWTVAAVGPGDKKALMGFSLNPPRAESQFVDLDKADLDALFGKEGYALAGDDKALQKVTELIRVGHEIFPWLMFLILILVTAENYLANTFYKEATGPTITPTGSSAPAPAAA
ncbi:BatA domain-containing protein [Paludisphaera mucosa]|uniref:BatA domain-containing protein n=1 Tax=Paludisphaera mucosa TaxID=3030827 RepID=A0ABT6FIB9_9BACT|nr:BatA domain-containing protein [Paludisphaera mucosa]MDG3007317.1 BatA domain-containing protein [Paludisphaera mucosa]